MLFEGEPVELMFQYFVKFGDKPCCITDLKVFLDLIARDQHVQVITISKEISQDCLLYKMLFAPLFPPSSLCFPYIVHFCFAIWNDKQE